jgi:DNA-binding transcriptional ArsR family regulator
MIEFRLSLDTLGNTRFGYSPLGELASSVRALSNQHAAPVLRPWLSQVQDDLRTVDLRLLRAVIPAGYLAPDFLFAWSADPRVTIEDQLERLSAVPDDVVARQLSEIWEGRQTPAVLEALINGLGRQRLTDALLQYWDAAIRPHWTRIRSAIDDDIAYRANRVLSGGLYGLLENLHPEVSVRADRLAIDKPQHPDAAYATPMITLIPSVFVWPQLIVAHSAPNCFELQYATRSVGRVWEGMSDDIDVHEAVAALVGRTRAAILTKLARPRSTTQLARLLDASPASVSAHLSVLRRNGLVSAGREGRSVLYQRTALATSILAASEPSATQQLA